MKIRIDQSWKIEDTSKHTVIASSNSKSFSVLIPANDKKKLQELFRDAKKPRIFVYKTFSILVFCLIKNHLKDLDSIEIDKEYPEREDLIKDFLLQMIWNKQSNFDKNKIRFVNVTKRSKSHKLAYSVFRKKKKPNKVVSYKDVLRYLLK